MRLLLSEEVGEVAHELKRSVSVNYEPFEVERLADELADTFVVLSALATSFDVDIEAAVEGQFFDKDSARRWRSAELKQDN